MNREQRRLDAMASSLLKKNGFQFSSATEQLARKRRAERRKIRKERFKKVNDIKRINN